MCSFRGTGEELEEEGATPAPHEHKERETKVGFEKGEGNVTRTDCSSNRMRRLEQ